MSTIHCVIWWNLFNSMVVQKPQTDGRSCFFKGSDIDTKRCIFSFFPHTFDDNVADQPSGLIRGFTSRTTTRCPIVFGTPQMIRAKSGQERKDKGGGCCKQHPPSAPPVFLSTVSVLLFAGRRSLRSSRVYLSWLFKVRDKRHAVVLSLSFFLFFPASVCVKGRVAKPKTHCVTRFHISENAYGKMTGK